MNEIATARATAPNAGSTSPGLDFVDIEAAMTLAPGRPGARSLVSTGKTTAADGLAVLTPARRALRARRDDTGNTSVLFKTLDLCKI